MGIQEQVEELEVLLNASRLETIKLERKIWKIRNECIHDRVVETTNETFLATQHGWIKTYKESKCNICGVIMTRITEEKRAK